ncbi:glycosyltransferase family 25 protein, partial [Lentithecium fluviatile CBS 122367]
MRRISIDPLGMMSPRSSGAFIPAKRRSAWYLRRSRLLTTVLFFVGFWVWLNFGGHVVEIPKDSFEFVRDESLTDILNSTLGFQKIFVLNLPFRTDRRDAITLSAATSNIKLEFVDGVTGESIRQSAYPPPTENLGLASGIRGTLILEDDVDWDIRIRQNLQRFALASRFLSENKEILSSSSSPQYKIDNRPNPETPETTFHILSDNGITTHLPSLALSSIYQKTRLPEHETSGLTSPYGDPAEWDILWIGHCGAGFPRYSDQHRKTDITTANVILTHANDDTVPVGRHLKAHPFQDKLDPVADAYPPHTRIYHRASGGELCTVAYAVSQRGARRLLHQFGLKGWNGIFDSELGRWCAMEDPNMGKHPPPASNPQGPLGDGKGRMVGKGRERVCLTSQPPLFAHHHPMEGESDIGGLGGGYATRFETKYLRLSVRMNLERIVQGLRTVVDQWPDE